MALDISLTVVPRAGCFKCVKTTAGGIKCYIKSAPEKGKANKELIKTLAKALGVRQVDIEILQGLTSRSKRLRIHTALTEQELLARLGLAEQTTFL